MIHVSAFGSGTTNPKLDNCCVVKLPEVLDSGLAAIADFSLNSFALRFDVCGVNVENDISNQYFSHLGYLSWLSSVSVSLLYSLVIIIVSKIVTSDL